MTRTKEILEDTSLPDAMHADKSIRQCANATVVTTASLGSIESAVGNAGRQRVKTVSQR